MISRSSSTPSSRPAFSHSGLDFFFKNCWYGGVFSAFTSGVANKSGASRRTDLSSLNQSTSLKRTVATRHANMVLLTAMTFSIAKASSVFLSALSLQMEPPDVLLVSDASFLLL